MLKDIPKIHNLIRFSIFDLISFPRLNFNELEIGIKLTFVLSKN